MARRRLFWPFVISAKRDIEYFGFWLPSAHSSTINPGTALATFSASRARLSRFLSFTCGTSRKIGALTCPRPDLAREATANPRVLIRAFSATSRLGPLRR
jgi:hypothetical protein